MPRPILGETRFLQLLNKMARFEVLIARIEESPRKFLRCVLMICAVGNTQRLESAPFSLPRAVSGVSWLFVRSVDPRWLTSDTRA